MIRYFIRTTLERTLDKSIKEELGDDYILLVDLEHKPIESFINQLETIAEYDSVLIEDDAILCKDFRTRIEEVIENNSDKVINFWSQPYSYFKTHKAILFSSNVCTYYPRGLGKRLAHLMREHINDYKEYDYIESKCLGIMNKEHLIHRPCLVQHKHNSSLMGNDNHPYFADCLRATPYFIDYLDELGINYEDAYKKENKEKLMTLMRSHLLSQ